MRRNLLLIMVAVLSAAMSAVAQSRMPYEKLMRAKSLMRNERYIEGEQIIDSLLAQDPDNCDALLLRSVVLTDEYYDRGEESLEYCNRAIANYTRKSIFDKGYFYYIRGYVKVKNGDVDGAIDDYSKAINLKPHKEGDILATIHYNRGVCYRYLGDYPQAEADLLAAQEYNDNELWSDIMLMRGRIYIETERYEEAFDMSQELMCDEEFVAEGYDMAISALLGLCETRTAIDYAIDMVEAHIDMPTQKYKSIVWSDIDYARKQLRHRIIEDDDNERAPAYFIIADCLHDYEALLMLFIKAREIFYFDDDYLLFMRAQTYANAGMYSDAIRHITHLIESTDYIVFLSRLFNERCNFYCSAGEYEKAVADASGFIDLSADAACGYYMRGCNYEYMGDDDAAMADYNQGIELDEYYAPLYYVRGEQYLKRGDTERAKADFERVLELDKEAVSDSVRHFALHRLGREEEACEWIDCMLSYDCFDCNTHFDRARLYARMGDYDEAWKSFRNALHYGFRSKAAVERAPELEPIRADTENYNLITYNHFKE